MKLSEIIDSFDPEVASMRGVQLYCNKVRHGLKNDSSNSVDRIRNLATCVYVGGDKISALRLYQYLDDNVDKSWMTRSDLAESIGLVRLFLVYIYKIDNLLEESNELLAKDNLSSTQNLETYDVFEYENVLQDRLSDSVKKFEFYEKDVETSYSDILRMAIKYFQQAVLLTVRLPEIAADSFDCDIDRLPNFLVYFSDKLAFYLTLK